MNDNLKDQDEIFKEIGDSIATGISDALVSAVEGTKSLGEAAKGVLSDISNQLLKLGINTLLKSTGLGIFENLQGFANGGKPPVGKPSLVGEKGPELFVPSGSGTIIPNKSLGGQSVVNNISVSVDASGTSVQGNDADANQFGEQLAAAIQAEIINQKRSGGLLN